MRLPGFLHRKGPPFRSRILQRLDALPYTLNQIISGLALQELLTAAPSRPAPLPDQIPRVRGTPHSPALRARCGTAARVRRGILAALTVENERCMPPLGEAELRSIAAWIDEGRGTSTDADRCRGDGVAARGGNCRPSRDRCRQADARRAVGAGRGCGTVARPCSPAQRVPRRFLVRAHPPWPRPAHQRLGRSSKTMFTSQLDIAAVTGRPPWPSRRSPPSAARSSSSRRTHTEISSTRIRAERGAATDQRRARGPRPPARSLAARHEGHAPADVRSAEPAPP